ncbi:MAG: 4-phosphoerythronate dehydrogenase [Muribaculum sp.]|nr:4-phosphoerythronate dehydrogenase [Muribaculum sp.]
MKIVVEKNIPFIRGLLEPYAEVVYLAPEEIDAGSMADADALVTRTRTRCDEALLKGSKCRFIATATIGTDHIDLDYCRRNGINVANAPGCNAPAVAQYVISSILYVKRKRGDKRPLNSLTLGIVGVGHVGTIVDEWASSLGMNVLLCDPPRAEREGSEGFVSLAEIARKADVVTFHTPMTRDGKYPTYHLADAEFLEALVRTPILINSARGPVVDNGALADAVSAGKVSDIAIDCWEGEPDISRRLLDLALVATPHIAGYSRQGKIRATAMAVEALCRHFGLPIVRPVEPVPADIVHYPTADLIEQSYSPEADTEALRSNPENFETLRNRYAYRDEPGI